MPQISISFKKNLPAFLFLFLVVGYGYAQKPITATKSDAPVIKPVANQILSALAANTKFSSFSLFQKIDDEVINDKLKPNVDSFAVLEIRQNELNEILKARPQFLKLAIPGYQQQALVVMLKQHTITSDNFLLKTSSGEIATGADLGLHYWGIIDSNANSTVAISIFNGEVMGVISSGPGNIVLGKLKGDKRHIIYNDLGLKGKSSFLCGNEIDTPFKKNINHQNSQQSGQRSVNCVDLHWEINYDIFQDRGSVTSAANFATGIFNQSQLLFANDGIDVLLSSLFVWNTPSPYSGVTSFDWLASFQNNLGSFNGDLAHLITYSNSTGGVAATIGGLCSSSWADKKCFSGIDDYYWNIPSYSWTVSVITHEQGHLLGSRHTHACVWNGNNTAIDACGSIYGASNNPPVGYEGSCSGASIPSSGGTIMSYCHLGSAGINFNAGFGAQPAAVISNSINNASCLDICSPCAVPANNDCVGATLINDNTSCSFTNGTVDCATDDGFPVTPSCNGTSATQYGVFYKFQAQSDNVTIQVNPTNTSSIGLDAVVVLYSGFSCNNLNQVSGGCADDNDYGVSETLTVPVTQGQYYWVRVYDFGSVQPALGNGGFRICVTHTTVPITDDIYVLNATVDVSTVLEGESINVICDQYYAGNTSTTLNPNVGYFLSTDCNKSGDDVLLGNDESGISSADLYDPEAAALTIPLGTSAGNYYILFVADYLDEVFENNTGNNVACVPLTVTAIPATNDIYVTNNTVNVSSVNDGDVIMVTCDQYYAGTSTSNLFPDVGFYLSSDCSFDINDVFLDNRESSVSASDLYDTESATLTIPAATPAANYYILFFGDYLDEVGEIDNLNNIECIPLTVTNATNPQPNFMIVTAHADSVSIAAGNALQITYTLANFNTGTNVNQPLGVGITLTPVNSNCPQSIAVGQALDFSVVSALDMNDNIETKTHQFTIPAQSVTPGNYYVTVYADYDYNGNSMPETDETDNVFCFPLTITERRVPNQAAANFYASQTSGSCPLTVDFFNNSTGNPTNYVWEFLGNDVSPPASTAQNPTVTYTGCGHFTVKLTIVAAGGLTDDEVKSNYIDIACPCISSVTDLTSAGEISIGPNPSNGIFTIDVFNADDLKAKIFNALGQIVATHNLNAGSNLINLSAAARGVYYLQVSNAALHSSRKIIIE